jgi:hypothetical protein
MNALGQRPFVAVSDLIAEIKQQAENQLAKVGDGIRRKHAI